MTLISTFHGKIEVGEQAFPFLNPTVIFTTSEQISGISQTDSLGHGNQVPCVCTGWGAGWHALKCLYLLGPLLPFSLKETVPRLEVFSLAEFGGTDTELALYETHLLIPFVPKWKV